MTDADYIDDQALLTNTSAQAESLLHRLEQAARSIRFYTNKTEFMCFKQDEDISTLRGKPLKLVDQFKYLSSNISFTVQTLNAV